MQSLEKQHLIADQVLTKTATEPFYEECSVFGKVLSNNGTWIFELEIDSS